jgi:transposase-like protein
MPKYRPPRAKSPGRKVGRREKLWVRWFAECGVCTAHIAFVFARRAAQIERTIEPARKGPVPAPLIGPPLRSQKGPEIHGPTAAKVRSLRSLGYEVDRIAGLLGLRRGDVKDFLDRIRPLRRPQVLPHALTRPRSRKDHRRSVRSQARAAHRRWLRQKTSPPKPKPYNPADPDAWGYRDPLARLELEEHRAAAAARTGPMARTTAQEATAAGPPAIAPPPSPGPAPPPWIGDVSGHFKGPLKLSQEDIDTIRSRLASGTSCFEMARRYGVTPNTIRRHAGKVPLDRKAKPVELPTAPVAYKRGVARWDKPLGRTKDGHRTVLVECECGDERYVWTRDLLRDRPSSPFTGACKKCLGREWSKVVLSPETKAEVRRLRSEGAKVKDLAARFGVTQPTITKTCTGIHKARGTKPQPIEVKVRKAREQGATIRELARRFSLSLGAVVDICEGTAP